MNIEGIQSLRRCSSISFVLVHTRINIYAIFLPCLFISSGVRFFASFIFFGQLSRSLTLGIPGKRCDVCVPVCAWMIEWACDSVGSVRLFFPSSAQFGADALVCLSYTSSSFHNNKHYYYILCVVFISSHVHLLKITIHVSRMMILLVLLALPWTAVPHSTLCSFSVTLGSICLVSFHSVSLVCARASRTLFRSAVSLSVRCLSQLCVNISIQKPKCIISTACAHSFSSDELMAISRAVGCSVCRLSF